MSGAEGLDLLVLNAGAAAKPDLSGAQLRLGDAETAFAERGINTGDLLVCDSTLRHIRARRVRTLGFQAAADPARWPKEQPDITLIRGSNYIQEGFDLGPVLPLLDALKGPVVAVGVGAQAEVRRRLELPAGSVAFWRRVGERSASLGVRGAFSAEVLEAIGVRNTRLIGCPSLFRSLRPRLAIRPCLPLSARIGLTLNRYLSGAYAGDFAATHTAQRALLHALARRPASRLYAQGEREEMRYALGRPEARGARLPGLLEAYGMADDPYAADLFARRLAAHLDVEAWAADVAQNTDAMLGFRLHGNIMALHQGLPAVAFVYDTRTEEMAELLRLPAHAVGRGPPPPPETLLAEADFMGFEAAYAERFAAYRLFLEENGLPHRLGPDSAPA